MPKVLAVIHHRNDALSARNAATAAAAGCAGIVMIQMSGRDWEIDVPALAAKSTHPGLLVVANRLSMSAATAIARDAELRLDGSWSDDRVATSRGLAREAAAIRKALLAARAVNPDFLFFGSVAFKGQEREHDPPGAAKVAAAEPWIVTTSGPATGQAPNADKLRAMAQAAGRHRLAVASGITPSNAEALASHVAWVLVSTGITIDPSTDLLDPVLTRRLVEVCTALNGTVDVDARGAPAEP